MSEADAKAILNDAAVPAFDDTGTWRFAGCGCPVCAGRVQIFEDAAPVAADLLGPQAYLNADDRAGAVIGGKTSYTVERAALQLTGYTETGSGLAPQPGWGGVAGRAFTVTYAFRADAPASMPDDTAGFARFNITQINLTEQLLRGWSDVANINFNRVGSGNSGEAAYSNNAAMLFGNYTSGADGASAFAFYPGSTLASRSSGDVWVNSTIGSNANPQPGNYGGQVLVHEIGHAIGLAHPGEYNANGDAAFTYAVDAEYYQDSRQYTVMSYFSEANTGANFRGTYGAAPMLDDIYAAQLEYGANLSTRTGATTYGFNSNAERSWFFAASSSSRLIFAVWDAGGSDTFDFSGYAQDQLIDLRQGAFSNVGGLTGNVAVALNTVIENAIGGSGSDRINGNSAGNAILAGRGNDTLSGNGGSDFLRGEDGNDSLTGGGEFDDMHGNMGNDTLHGGDAGDWVVGGKDQDALYGDAGGDVVWGNLGNDTCEGGEGDDQVRGGQGDDVVRGGGGNDWLSGDLGSDTITGGAGADIFHGFAEASLDRVTDFNFAEGDRVLLDPGTAWTASQVGADVVVAMTASQMVLANVQLSSLGPGWILTG